MMLTGIVCGCFTHQSTIRRTDNSREATNNSTNLAAPIKNLTIGKVEASRTGDISIVVYDVPVTQEARDNHVWYGVIAATAGVAADQSSKTNGTDRRC